MTNHLPVKASRESEDTDWNFELDVDALVVQAKACPWPIQLLGDPNMWLLLISPCLSCRAAQANALSTSSTLIVLLPSANFVGEICSSSWPHSELHQYGAVAGGHRRGVSDHVCRLPLRGDRPHGSGCASRPQLLVWCSTSAETSLQRVVGRPDPRRFALLASPCCNRAGLTRDALKLACMGFWQVVAKELKQLDCYPVFLGKHLKERYYKGAACVCQCCCSSE